MPVINEITEDDVNDLSDQIRQLKVLSFSVGVTSVSYLFIFFVPTKINYAVYFVKYRKNL